jgi:hypothetical protein
MPAGLPCARVDFELTTKCGDAFWYFPCLMAIPNTLASSQIQSRPATDNLWANAGLAASVVVAAVARSPAPWMKLRRSVMIVKGIAQC